MHAEPEAHPNNHRPILPLFELVERYVDLLVKIDDAEGELTPELAAELEALEPQLERKVEAIAAVHAMLTEESEACDRLAKTYADRAKRKARNADVLKARCKDALDVIGVRKVATPTVTASLQANPPKVELLLADAELPDEAFVITRKVDLGGIKERLKAGEPCTYARLVSGGDHLRFRR